MGIFGELETIVPIEFRPGVLARAIEGDRLTLSVIEVAPDVYVPEHSQEQEQLAMLVQGSATLHVGRKAYPLGPGSMWRLEGHVEHSVQVGPEGAVFVEAFAPPREDWNRLGRVEVRTPAWPAAT